MQPRFNCAKIGQSGDLTADDIEKALYSSKRAETRDMGAPHRKVETGYAFAAKTAIMDFAWFGPPNAYAYSSPILS